MLQHGFQRTHGDKEFSRDELFNEWGAADETVFQHIQQYIQTHPDTDAPYFHTVMTISSREPWTVPHYHRLDNPIDNSFAYTDQCIHNFMENLRRCGQADNTLFIILPDHGALSRPNYSFSSPALMHIPLIMAGGAIRRPQVIPTLMNQSDLAATLLGQLGLPHTEYTFSRDILSQSYRYPTAIHTSKTHLTFIDSTGVSQLDLDADHPTDTTAAAQLRIRKAKAILQTLYLDVSRR